MDLSDCEDDVGEGSGQQGAVHIDGYFQPLLLLPERDEPKTTRKRVTLCINLPSGVSSTGFSVRLLEGGDILEVTVTWPALMVDTALLHRKWTRVSPDDTNHMNGYHSEIVGFEHALKGLRNNTTDQGSSVARISIPFPVETYIVSQNALARRDDSTRSVYIRIKAVVDDYAFVNNSLDFEVV